VRKSGELGVNLLGQQAYKLQDLGLDIRPHYPPYFYDWLMWALHRKRSSRGTCFSLA
jgi:hypothetical protein